MWKTKTIKEIMRENKRIASTDYKNEADEYWDNPCKLYLDHKVVWNGDKFVCEKCGIEFIPKDTIKQLKK